MLGYKWKEELMTGNLNKDIYVSEEDRRSAIRKCAQMGQVHGNAVNWKKQVIQPVLLDLNSVVTDIDRMLRRLIGEDIDLTIVRESNLKMVKADRGQMEQILMNLAVNARDAMPQGGKLIIETANVEVDEAYIRLHPFAKIGNYVVLSVSDSGCGIPQHLQAHVFEPFFTT